MTVTVDGLEVADPADGWMRAGFSVDSDAVCRVVRPVIEVGGSRIQFSERKWEEATMSMQEPEADGRGLGVGGIATLGGLALLAVFMIQNTDDVTVHFLTFDFEWPVWLIVLASAAVGAFVWFGLGVLRRHRRRKERREDRRD